MSCKFNEWGKIIYGNIVRKKIHLGSVNVQLDIQKIPDTFLVLLLPPPPPSNYEVFFYPWSFTQWDSEIWICLESLVLVLDEDFYIQKY